MNKEHFENQFLDYIEGQLSEEHVQAFEDALSKDPGLKASFEAYQQLMQTEAMIAEVEVLPTPHFVELVMDNIDNREVSSIWRYFMELTRKRLVYGGLSSLLVLLICVKLGTEITDEMLFNEQRTTQFYAVASSVPATASTQDGTVTTYNDTRLTNTFDRILGKEEQSPSVTVAEPLKKDVAPADDSSRQPEMRFEEKAQDFEADMDAGEGRSLPAAKEHGYGNSGGAVQGDPRVAPPLPKSKPQIAEKIQADLKQKRSIPSGSGRSAEQISNIQINDLVASSGVNKKGMSLREQQLAGSYDKNTTAKSRAPMERKRAGAAIEYEANAYDELHYAPPQPHRFYPQQELSRERYVEYSEQPRIFVKNEPRSTFSIDVDTGSYTNARRILQQGMLPPAESVRIEEFVNYFDYGYPSRSNLPFTLNYEIAPSPFNEGRYLVSFGIKAKDLGEERKPWNLVFLIDVSGSMNTPMKLDLVKRSLRVLVQNMQSNDTVALVTYAGSSTVALHPTTLRNKSTILHAIDSLRAGGSTNGASGIHLAYQTAQDNFKSDGVNRVILATDGDFNVGTTSHQQLVQLIEKKRRSGITLTTIGVGEGNINEAMMEQIANKGNGNYFYLDSFKEGRRVFADKLASTVEVVAKDVKLQVEFNPANVVEYRLVGYDNRKLRNRDFDNDKIDAGEIGAGHTVTALYEVILSNTEGAKNIKSKLRYQQAPVQEEVTDLSVLPKELAFLKIRYKEPQGTKSKLISYPLLRSDVKASFADASTDFRFASAVAGFGLLLRNSQYIDDMSYQDIERIASQSTGADTHGARREFIELVRNAQSLDYQN